MIIDLESTNPEGWDSDSNPHAGEGINDAVIYEMHIRDVSSDSSSGIENVGKYLGLTETGTTTEMVFRPDLTISRIWESHIYIYFRFMIMVP